MRCRRNSVPAAGGFGAPTMIVVGDNCFQQYRQLPCRFKLSSDVWANSQFSTNAPCVTQLEWKWSAVP